MAPPHTRGWTLDVRRHQGLRGGSPAHAGMDPSMKRVTGGKQRLPRTRGDGPAAGRATARIFPAPPHTRGWTRYRTQLGRGCQGSPAHAGMDPCPHRCATRFPRLPRTRGDGPGPRAAERALGSAPPHTRGWTWRQGRSRWRAMGSPAHAGMDPSWSRSGTPWFGLPRTRGDGPLARDARRQRPQAPPHTRGWTQTMAYGHPRGGGSPAHAGMDPYEA